VDELQRLEGIQRGNGGDSDEELDYRKLSCGLVFEEVE
jgi:hypothetical protein